MTSKAVPNAPSYDELEPRALWETFELLASVPRPSYKEAAVIEALKKKATGLGWECKVDSGGNLIVEVPATDGYDSVPPVILQAHVDMVAIKRESSLHVFEEDPIELITDLHNGEEIVRANNTTLGADNGIGVAAAFAVAMDPTLQRGPLELLLTVNEETGMTGAKDLDVSQLTGKVMLNLDTEEDNVIYIGCVGGMSAEMNWKFEPVSVPNHFITIQVAVSGLLGGHSGLEIDRNRGNSNQILCETLLFAGLEDFRLIQISGGTFTNAIPAQSDAVISCSEEDAEKLRAFAKHYADEVKEKLGKNGDGVKIGVSSVTSAEQSALSFDDTKEVLHAIVECPHGVLAMAEGQDGVLESSANVARLKVPKAGEVRLEISIRSLIRSKLDEIVSVYENIAKEYDASFGSEFRYPPWEPNPDAEILSLAVSTHEQLFGFKPKVSSIHGGLECGILSSTMKGTEMISIGPRIEEAHTPDERVFVSSVQTFYDYLKLILQQFSDAKRHTLHHED